VAVPLLRKVVTKVDATVAAPLEAVVRHDLFGIGLAVAGRAKSELLTRSQRISRRGLHALNIPAASDVNRLLAEFAYVERQLRVLIKAINDPAQSIEGRPRPVELESARPSGRD